MWLQRPVKILKKLGKGMLAFIIFTSIATTLVVWSSGVQYKNIPAKTLTINDITQLNPVTVARIVKPESIDEIASEIASTTGPISIGGGRYSQGGQTSYPDSLHFDMRSFNNVIRLDKEQKLVTVQAGITWRDLQTFIDPYDLSIKIMQTYANFTVGGSLSVNVHGRYIGEGPLVRSVSSIKLILANGKVVNASPHENADLFYAAIGGYGGIGVIAEATLKLVPNVKVERHTSTMKLADYYEHFKTNIRDNKAVVFHNADIYPPDFEAIRNVSWLKTDKPVTEAERLIPKNKEYGWQPKVAGFVADYDVGKWVRQTIFDPIYYAQEAVYWRNYEASYDVNELEPSDRKEYTDALREYFVPVANFSRFAEKMKQIFQKHEVNIINVSIRHALPDPGTLLAWANEEVFAFVVYYRQGTSLIAQQKVKAWSKEIIDAVISEGGAYYLPYQVHASTAQFKKAYPRAEEYFAVKNKVDPNNRFRNKLWQAHYPKNKTPFEQQQAKIAQYYRNEGQTLLTIPEWYLVFNPLEYSNFLSEENNPSDFPFFASIDEYWKLYDKTLALSDNQYPSNDEYMTMLQVIGISTTVEYMYKGAYENTIGRFTHWTADAVTAEENIIRDAHSAYSELIFHQAWYEFDFAYWLKKIWTEPEFFQDNFIRKLERKLFFTLEFGFKELYSGVIKFAAKSAYDESDGKIYLTLHSDKNLEPEQVFPGEILANHDKEYLLSVPRWGGFTSIMPKLAALDVAFTDVSGNYKIAVSFITDKNSPFKPSYGKYLFDSQVVSSQKQKRIIYMVKVSDLAALLNEMRLNDHQIEHIYDY
ncbi:hypothetical protein tinsulaeT_16140 [Thalassotalea insulae]|uniref:FAD-binding PCMH-type domain-containing protein n=1 Tax=Thalassotalea insulae TaxID=2056778 RepID=A0ABQ6GSG7_9GAMM|nr:FAD-binding oxidoreductase [Thalassotalea insulae]GLX78274.1 hypothetical protein tinsulaeT_16140 [Thalassotalea insulae]